jgi:hypothetical protein
LPARSPKRNCLAENPGLTLSSPMFPVLTRPS